MAREAVESGRYRRGKDLWRKGFAEEPSPGAKDYKFVRITVMICATLVNRHTDTAFDRLYY